MALFFFTKTVAQAPIEQFYLPYYNASDYPGPFIIKTYINFVVAPAPATPWLTAQQAEVKEAAALAHLNKVYNPYNIYFVPGSGCENSGNKIFEYEFTSGI